MHWTEQRLTPRLEPWPCLVTSETPIPSADPYLDYLATATESQSPIFSLEWTAASQRQVDRALETPDSELVQKPGIFSMQTDG